ncbi:MAG: hypothetical protein HYY17_11220 [Planctomycetes bacterium]|nr:hypothetical protein [Planctomycetota bacterium]
MNLLTLLCLLQVADPASKDNGADYLIVAPAEFVPAIAPLADYRAKQGYRVAVATTESIAKPWKDARAFVRFAAKEWKAPAPRFLLLVGDSDRIPSIERRSAYQTKRFANDDDLGTDHLYGVLDDGLDAAIAVGRFPADTADEVRAMVEKTIEYERDLKPGAWQKKIDFITGEGGFSPFIDQFIEAQFTALVAENIPAAYDLEVAYSKTTSRYSPFPPRFNENAVRLLNEGSLFYVYVGHGHRTGFDQLRWQKKTYPIFDAANAKDIDVRNGLPIMFVVACTTGFYDFRGGDCVGEDLFKRRRGPVAYIGGSRIIQPYPSALLSKGLIEEVFHARRETMGWALVEAKKKLLAPDESKFRKTADTMAGGVQGADNLEPMRKDCVLHYNLFGDPALRLRRPDEGVKLEFAESVAPGGTIQVAGRSPVKDGRARVALESLRTKFARPLPRVVLGADDFERQITERYKAANDKTIVFIEVEAKGGEFRAALPVPHDLEAGDYVLKVTVLGEGGTALGAGAVKCAAK